MGDSPDMMPTKRADETELPICTIVEWMDEPYEEMARGSASRSTVFTAGKKMPMPA